jgi:hypothetical protein
MNTNAARVKNYLALCLFCKDENQYLEEWLDYHFLLGVEHVFIYDNASRVPIRETVKKYIDQGKVTVEWFPDDSQQKQFRAYGRCLREHGSQFFWMGFIDTDEFIVPKKQLKLTEFLAHYENYGALAVCWYCFGSNGLATRQERVLEAFVKRSSPEFALNTHVKSIVNTQFSSREDPDHAHLMRLKDGYFCVDEKGNRVDDAMHRLHTSENIQINHYILRSREEFQDKVKRGNGWELGRESAFFETYDAECNRVEDRTILLVKKALIKDREL